MRLWDDLAGASSPSLMPDVPQPPGTSSLTGLICAKELNTFDSVFLPIYDWQIFLHEFTRHCQPPYPLTIMSLIVVITLASR